MRWKEKPKESYPKITWKKRFAWIPRWLPDAREWVWLEWVCVKQTHLDKSNYRLEFYSEESPWPQPKFYWGDHVYPLDEAWARCLNCGAEWFDQPFNPCKKKEETQNAEIKT